MKFYNILIFIVVSSITIFAQGAGSYGISDPRSTAMGGTNAISSRGVYSFNSNPANIALSQGHDVEVSAVLPFPNFSGSVGTDFLSMSNYNYYFGGVTGAQGNIIARDLTAEDKTNFKSLFSKGSNFNALTSTNLFSITINTGEAGAFGFAITDIAGINGTLPKDLMDLAVDGNEIGRVYNFNDINLKAAYLREYSFSYARDLGGLFGNNFLSFTGGISLKIVSGLGYLQTQQSSASLETLTDNSIRLQSDVIADIAVSPDFGIDWGIDNTTKNRSSSISAFPKPAGSGFGISFGLAAQIDSVWGIGFSLTNIGSVTWDKETVRYSSFGSFLVTSVTDSTQTTSLSDSLKFKGSYTSGFKSKLPGALRLGVSMQLDDLLVVFGYNQGLNNEPFNTTKPRFALGFEWKPLDLIPIRSGFSFGGTQSFKWSFGFGLDFGLLEMDFATTNFSNVLRGNNAKGIDFSFGSRWKF